MTLPTEPGYYYWRGDHQVRWGALRVLEVNGRLVVDTDAPAWETPEDMGGQWGFRLPDAPEIDLREAQWKPSAGRHPK